MAVVECDAAESNVGFAGCLLGSKGGELLAELLGGDAIKIGRKKRRDFVISDDHARIKDARFGTYLRRGRRSWFSVTGNENRNEKSPLLKSQRGSARSSAGRKPF